MAGRGCVHLVGSLPLADSEEVFRLLAAKLGDRAKRMPDGETGERKNWIRWQRHVFDGNPAFSVTSVSDGIGCVKDGASRPIYEVNDKFSPDQISFEPLGFAAEAQKSFAIFRQLKKDAVIPSGTRFQVSLPTTLAIVSGFVALKDRGIAEAALERAMKREVEEILTRIPRDQLAIQWDVCHEILGIDDGFKLHFGNVLENVVARVARHVSWIPADVQVGIHLCYGDPGGIHIIEPGSTGTCVRFANALFGRVNKPVDWLHLPIPVGWNESDYYQPLTDLAISPTTDLFLGLVHPIDSVRGTKRRMDLARQFVENFGVATECGFGRRDPKVIPALLELHDGVAGERSPD